MLLAGYDGDYHRGSMNNTVGLYFRNDTFERATSDGRMLYTTFDGSFGVAEEIQSHKGAVLAVLRHFVTGKDILAVGTHFSVPKLPDGILDTSKPLGEVAQLRNKIDDVFRQNNQGRSIPIILAGDFNSVPIKKAGVADPDVYNELTLPSGGWELISVYKSVLGEEPLFTAWSPAGFRECIDYILVSREAFGSAEILNVLPDEIPEIYPSDHFPLHARLYFRTY